MASSEAPKCCSMSVRKCTNPSAPPGIPTPNCRDSKHTRWICARFVSRTRLAMTRRQTSPTRIGLGVALDFFRKNTKREARIHREASHNSPEIATSTNLPIAAKRAFATRRSRTATISRRCSGRMPLGPAADMARKLTPFSDEDGLVLSLREVGSGAWSRGAIAAAGRALLGSKVAAHLACAASSKSATSVWRLLVALLYAPSLMRLRARRALLPCFADFRTADRCR